jgi:hypothetical protein
MDFEIVQSFMMCSLGTWFWLNNILKKKKLKKFCMMAFIPMDCKQAKK